MAKKIRTREILISETPVAEYLPYSHHVTDKIISTKSAEYLSVWRIGGRSHQSASEQEVFQWVRELNNMIRGIASANVSLWSHIVRRRVYEYPDSIFTNPFCKALDDKYRESFTGYNLMVNELYLAVVFRPVADSVLSYFAKWEKQTLEEKKLRQDNAIEKLEDINRVLGATLRRYDAELLGTYDHGGHIFSQPLEFLALLVNGEHRPMPVCRDRFANYMAVNRPLFSKWGELGELRLANRVRRFGMLEVAEYDANTEPGQLNLLLESPYEFVLTQSFSALGKHAAKGFLQRHKQQLVDAEDVAIEQINEIDEALDQLMSGQFVMGEHHATLIVFDEHAEQVRDHLAAASAAFSEVGIMTKVCDLALEAAFWAQLPGNWAYRPRPMPITSLNFLCFSPFHNFLSGKPHGNPWGPAVTILKTISGTPLYFNFHMSLLDEDSTDKRMLGNTLFVGKAGTGKTVTMGFLLAQAQKFVARAVIFDKDRGMEVAVRAMGGCYLPLKRGVCSGFNPFQLDSTPENLSFLKELVRKLVTAGGSVITHADETEIDHAVNTLMHTIKDKSLRRLSILLQSLPNPEHEDRNAPPTVHARLLKWCEGGELGWLFDNATDALDLTTHQLYGFDVTDFLDDPATRMPTIMYLRYRTDAMNNSQGRFIYMFDEFWKMLDVPGFVDMAKNEPKTIRKKDGIFVFATQDASDIIDSPIAKTLTQQCATLVLLPNPAADYEDYVEGLKVTPAVYEMVKTLGEGSRQFVVVQGGSAAIAELNLHGFDDELLVLSGTPDRAALVEQIIAELGTDNPDAWLPVFYERAREHTREHRGNTP